MTRLQARCREFAAESKPTRAAGLAKELTLANKLTAKRQPEPDRHTAEIEDLASDHGFHNENTASRLNKEQQHMGLLTLEYFRLCLPVLNSVFQMQL